jgi:hypothetical protein
MNVWRFAARMGAVIGCLFVGTAVTATPAFAAQGVTVEITELSDTFEAGSSRPAQMTVVATKREGRDCLKVRWSLLLRVQNMSLDQLRVDRIEEDGSFPVDVETDGAQVRLTDEQLDPGTLCRDRTVTARYAFAFAEEAAAGRVTLRAEARDARNDFLESATATRNIEGDAVDPSSTPSDEASQEPSEEPSAEVTEEAAAPIAGGGVGQPIRPTAGSGGSGLLPVGLAVGGLMVFLGLTLLLRARRKMLRVQPVGRPGASGVWRGGNARTMRERR